MKRLFLTAMKWTSCICSGFVISFTDVCKSYLSQMFDGYLCLLWSEGLNCTSFSLLYQYHIIWCREVMRMGKYMRKVSWEHRWQHERGHRDLTKQRSCPQYLPKEDRERSVSDKRLEKLLGFLGRIMGESSMWASRTLKYTMGPLQHNPCKS